MTKARKEIGGRVCVWDKGGYMRGKGAKFLISLLHIYIIGGCGERSERERERFPLTLSLI